MGYSKIGDESIRRAINISKKFHRIAKLGKVITEKTGIDENVDDFGFNKWTLLKLMFLQMYVPLYTSIIKNYFAGFNYIDLFAGSGVGKLKDDDVVIAGSSLIALSAAVAPFTNAFFIEFKGEKLSLLEKRVEYLKELSKNEEYRDFIFTDISSTNTNFISNDANLAVHEIFDYIEEKHSELYQSRKKGLHNLIFIDPYGINFEWKSLERILTSKVRSDIIMLFNSYTVGLQANNHIEHDYKSEALDKFFGDDDWKLYIKEKMRNMTKHPGIQDYAKWLREYYIDKIKQQHKKGYIIETISLPLELQNRQYDLLFIVRKTSSGNPFMNGVRRMRETLEQKNNEIYELIDELKHCVTGERLRLPGLLEYIINEYEREYLKPKKKKKSTRVKNKDFKNKDNQLTIHDYIKQLKK